MTLTLKKLPRYCLFLFERNSRSVQASMPMDILYSGNDHEALHKARQAAERNPDNDGRWLRTIDNSIWGGCIDHQIVAPTNSLDQ